MCHPADTTPPVLILPSDQTVEALGPNGAPVTYVVTEAPINVLITSAVGKHGRPVSNGATVPSKSITFQLKSVSRM